MRLIEIIRFIIDNKALIEDIVDLINEIISMFGQGTAVALSDEAVETFAKQYPVLKGECEAQGLNFLELIMLIVANKDLLLQLVDTIKRLFK